MQDILNCAMGLDVHRDMIVACLAKGELGTDPEIEIRSFSTLIPEMQKLRDWVLETDCHYVTMKSAGIYWQPIYEMLEICFGGEINILAVNAQHMKNVPGRKTDMRDVTQQMAGANRRQLRRGANQNQLLATSQMPHNIIHQAQVNHGGLIYNDEVGIASSVWPKTRWKSGVQCGMDGAGRVTRLLCHSTCRFARGAIMRIGTSEAFMTWLIVFSKVVLPLQAPPEMTLMRLLNI